MSQMKLDNLFDLVPIETALPAPGKVYGRAGEPESFDDHLLRVRGQSEQTAAGAESDPAPTSPAQAASDDDDTRQSMPESEQATHDQDRDPLDSANAASGENETGNSSPDDAEAGSQTPQEQEADTDRAGEEAKVADPQKGSGKPLPKQPGGQGDKDNAGQPASDPTPAGQEGAKETVSQGAVAKAQAEDTNSAAQTLSSQAAVRGGSSAQDASEDNPAAGASSANTNIEPSDGTLGQDKDGTGDRNRSDKPADATEETPHQQPKSPAQASQVGAPPPAQRRNEKQNAADGRAGQRAGEHGAPNPADPAADPQPGAGTISTQPETSAAKRESLAGETNVSAADETAKPAASPTPDGRLNASLRISSSQQQRAGASPQPNQSSESAQVDRVRFVQRVARAFRTIGNRSGSVRLRLHPPELGSLRLQITVRDGQMTARVEAETSTARNLLLDNLPALRDRLAQQDIRVKQFDVSLMDRSPGGLPDQPQNQPQSHHHGGNNSAPQPAGEGDRDTGAVSGPGQVNRPGEGTELNVVI